MLTLTARIRKYSFPDLFLHFSEMEKQRQEREVTWLSQGHSAARHWPNCTWAQVHTSWPPSHLLPHCWVSGCWITSRGQGTFSMLFWFCFLISFGASNIIWSQENKRGPLTGPQIRRHKFQEKLQFNSKLLGASRYTAPWAMGIFLPA